MAEKTFAELVDSATEAARLTDAPLSERLRAVADEVQRLSPEFAGIVDRMVARLADNGVGLAAPRPGEPMPEFVLPDETGRLVSLSQQLEKGPAVISFNRGHWCPYCRLNVDALTKAQPEIARLGAQILAISPETVKWSAELKAYAKAPFHVLLTSMAAMRSRWACSSGSATRSERRSPKAALISRSSRATTPGCCRSRHVPRGAERRHSGPAHRSGLSPSNGDRRPDRRAARARQGSGGRIG